MDIRKTLEEAKRKVAEGGKSIDQKIERRQRRSHLLLGDALLWEECACALTSVYGARGYSTQSFRFIEEGTIGTLVQIGNLGEGWKQKLATALGGQQIAVNVRMFPKGDDLEVSIMDQSQDADVTVSIRLMPFGDNLEVSMGRGKWTDDVPRSKLGWQDLKPLVTEDGGRRWRHRYAVSGLRDAAEAWLLHRSGVMPSIVNIFGEREA